jgi:hypothetical protein
MAGASQYEKWINVDRHVPWVDNFLYKSHDAENGGSVVYIVPVRMVTYSQWSFKLVRYSTDIVCI